MPASQKFFDAYIACALWSSTDNAIVEGGPSAPDSDGGWPLDDNYGPEDIDAEDLAEMRKDCDNFVDANRSDLDASGLDDGQQGHDFWLTRNGHGAGFWDRGLGDVGERLSEACKPYGSVDLWVGDDRKIYSN